MSIEKVSSALQDFEKLEKKIKGFAEVLRDTQHADPKKKILWKEIYENAVPIEDEDEIVHGGVGGPKSLRLLKKFPLRGRQRLHDRLLPLRFLNGRITIG